ncbi:MAG: SMP-30/gluconolactonase/LRE family protein [Azoarcus sp.]|nr:SMP-30/gluconolactonase/LRE family protein [Azoarcus sp.]
MDQTTQDTHAVTRYSSRTTTVSTLADGTGSDARFHASNGIAIDKAGSLYVADTENHRIRKVSPTGEVSTLAGGEKGESDGTGSDAQFNAPFGISIDKAGNLYVADTENHRIRKVSPMGEVSTLTGSEKGYADGSGSAAKFERPTGIAIDASNNLYVADSGNNRIRKVTPTGEVSTLAGSGAIPWQGGFADGPGNAAQFGWPTGIAIDASNNLYVADANNHRIRKIAPNGEVSTLAGSGATGSKEGGFADGPGSAAQFKQPTDITIDKAGNLYVVDRGNSRIREITPNGEVSTLAGSGLGCADGPGSVAQFYLPSAIAIDASGNLYVADNGKYRIRKIVIE